MLAGLIIITKAEAQRGQTEVHCRDVTLGFR